MTLYKESMRRLFRVGMVLMLLCVVASLIWAGMSCQGQNTTELQSALEMAPVLAVYAFVGGVGLAFSGFSFLNRRAESDFYHSIPAKRVDLFCSTAAAAATWMLATVVLSSLASTMVYLLTGTPFVPLYPLMNVGFFFAAALLVFAAAAIGCALTGTWFSNIAVTGIVLFLPRYILFMIAYGVIADTGLVGWLDFKWLLNPCTNAATGLIVMLSRPLLQECIVNLGGMLWSLFVALAELAVAALLFIRRPSELAERGAQNRALQTVFACLLALPLLLLVAVVGLRWVSPIFLTMVLAAALACYVIYQLIVLRNFKRMLSSLPWFLCAVAVAAAVLLAGHVTTRRVQNDTPDAEDIAYVRFVGYDRDGGEQSYASLMISGIRFSEEELIELVADTLRNNLSDYLEYGHVFVDDEYFVNIEPVQIVLNSGRKINRKLIFPDARMLDEYLSHNEAYRRAIQQLPPEESLLIVTSAVAYDNYPGPNSNVNTEELFAVCHQYFDEQNTNKNVFPFAKYDPEKYDYYYGEYDGHASLLSGERQSYGTFNVRGYIGAKRYSDDITIRLATPKTASRMMALKNHYSKDLDGSRLTEVYQQARILDAQEAFYYLYWSLDVYNYPGQADDCYTALYNWYSNNTPEDSLFQHYPSFAPLFDELVEILRRGKPTDDPTALCVIASFSYQQEGESINNYWPQPFLAFSPKDEARLVEILRYWDSLQAAQKELLQQIIEDGQYIPFADDGQYMPFIDGRQYMPVPTPTPQPKELG